MNSSKYILILKDIREQLINYTNKNNIKFNSTYNNYSLKLNNKFEIKELDSQLDIYDKFNIHGVTYITANDWISVKPGIKIAYPHSINIKFMAIKLKYNNKYLPIEAIIHTFLHELAHTVTLPEAFTSKNIDKITKKIQPTVSEKKHNHLCKIITQLHFMLILLKFYEFVKN